MFFVSFASKERSIQINGLESTLTSISISVDSKWVSLALNSGRQEARGRNPLIESLRRAVQYSTESSSRAATGDSSW